MKKTLIAAAVMAASGVAFAASNVTLYGVIDAGAVVSKVKHNTTKVQIPSKPSYSNEDYPHRRCTLYPNPPKYLAKNATAIGTVNEETTVVIIIAFAITASAA